MTDYRTITSHEYPLTVGYSYTFLFMLEECKQIDQQGGMAHTFKVTHYYSPENARKVALIMRSCGLYFEIYRHTGYGYTEKVNYINQ